MLRSALLDTKNMLNPHILYGSNGKPYIEGAEDFHYNLSHSGNLVVLGYSDNNIGIDVEKICMNEGRKQVAEISFTKDELDYLSASSDEREYALKFSKIWTSKESYLKYLGTGLTKSMASFSVDITEGRVKDSSSIHEDNLKIENIFLEKEYCISVCGNNYNGIVINMITSKDLLEKFEY